MKLATRTAIFLSLLFTLVFGAAVVIALSFFEDRFIALASQDQLTALKVHGNALEEKISTAHLTLAAAGKLVDAKLLSKEGNSQRFLDSRTFLLGNFRQGLFLYGASGQLLVRSPSVAAPTGPGAQPSPEESALTQQTITSRKAQASRPFSRPQAPNDPLIALSAPILDSKGDVIGVLQGTLRLLDPAFAGKLAKVQVGASGYVYMLHRDRTMLMHPDAKRILAIATRPGQNLGLDRAIAEQYEGSIITTNSTGLHVLVTFVQLQSMDWVLAANFPMSEVREPFRRSLETVAGLALTACVLIFLAVTFVVRRLLLPVKQLTQHLADVGRGKAQPIAIPAAGEFGSLANAYNLMVTELGASESARLESEHRLLELNATLERRVSERTEELGQRNASLQEALDSNVAMKNELVRSEKLAALGKLVAGIAHELNTPIGNALLGASALRERTQRLAGQFDTGSLRRADFTDYQKETIAASILVENNLGRAADLIENFKQVAVRDAIELRAAFDLDRTIANVVSTVEHLIQRRAVSLHLALQSGATMDSYPGAIGQLLIHFLTNALTHAFPNEGSGDIWIATALLEQERVEIVFRDNGCGIAQADIGRIFDPFFTTRLGHGGSGLGLSIAYNIATGILGGDIEVHSDSSRETVFRVVLPRTSPTPP